jgi:hypothetical protein
MTHPQALEVLKLQSGASAKELKSSYRARAKEHHPDKGGDQENFILVKQAYDMLVEQGTTARVERPVIRGFGFAYGDPMAGVTIRVTRPVRYSPRPGFDARAAKRASDMGDEAKARYYEAWATVMGCTL